MFSNPYLRLVIHAVYAGACTAFTAAQINGTTRDIVLAFDGGVIAFVGYGAVSPTYKGVGVGKNDQGGNDANVGGGGGLR